MSVCFSQLSNKTPFSGAVYSRILAQIITVYTHSWNRHGNKTSTAGFIIVFTYLLLLYYRLYCTWQQISFIFWANIKYFLQRSLFSAFLKYRIIPVPIQFKYQILLDKCQKDKTRLKKLNYWFSVGDSITCYRFDSFPLKLKLQTAPCIFTSSDAQKSGTSTTYLPPPFFFFFFCYTTLNTK